MSATLKTQANTNDAKAFIATIENTTRRNDAFTLLELFSKITGEPAVMWGSSIIGFGKYHYKSDRSRLEGERFVTFTFQRPIDER